MEGAVYRTIFGLGACVMFGAAWSIWVRRTNAWRWYIVAFGLCGLSWLVFERIKVLERRPSDHHEYTTSQ